jgi:chitinase
MRCFKGLSLCAMALVLTACGGGSGGSNNSSAISSIATSSSSVVSSSSIVSTSSSSAGNSLKIVGYTPSWSTVESTIQYSKLTHINYAFVLPNDDGSLQSVPEPQLLESIVEGAHENNVKVVVSIGGWNDGDDSSFVEFVNTDEGRTRFTNAVLDLIDLYDLDGIDIDWEYPDPGTQADNYSLLMKQLADALHPNDKILTAAVVASGWTGGGVKSDVFDNVDFINLMAYDKNNGNHAPYSYAQESINYWSGRGLPDDKLVLGVPYYARPSWNGYNVKVNQNSANICRDTDGTDYWDGIPTMRQKAQLARNYGGIMTWELSQDTNNSSSLLTAMWEVITGAPMSYVCSN